MEIERIESDRFTGDVRSIMTRCAVAGSWGRILVMTCASCCAGGVGGRSRMISGGGVEDLGSC